MKRYDLTVWGIFLLFGVIMAVVVLGSFLHSGHNCHMDPAQMKKMRELAH